VDGREEMDRLLCTEEVESTQAAAPKRAFRHETLLNDRRVLRNLLAKEDAYMPSGSYFVFQQEIRPYMRTVLTKWMLDVRILVHLTLKWQEFFCNNCVLVFGFDIKIWGTHLLSWYCDGFIIM